MIGSPADASTCVLIVDDNPIYRHGLRRMLERAPGIAHVEECHSAVDVESLVRRLQPSIVLLDRRLLHVDSLHLLAKIRAASPAARIFLLSSEDDPDMRGEAFAAGADGYITKDTPDDVLLSLVAG